MEQRELGQLLNDLGNSDARTANKAGDAIIHLGHDVLPVLIDAFVTAPTNVQRRIVYLISELARSSSPFITLAQQTLFNALESEDWKVRRNAAVGLGQVGNTLSVTRILSALERETDAKVRASLILAFGKLADAKDAPLLHKIQLTSDEEQTAAHKVRDRLSALIGKVPAIDTESVLSPNIPVELWSRSGVADIVSAEAAGEGFDGLVLAPNRVRLKNRPRLKDILRIRSALFPVLVLEYSNSVVDPREFGQAFDDSTVAAEMIRLTKGTPVGYRLTVKPTGLPSLHKRRDWISQFAARSNKLVNRATGYSWEVFIQSLGDHVLLGARPAACNDDRFVYRKLDVPASVHPTLAAAAVRLGPRQPSDIVIDPFCGSGTLLAERAIFAPYSRLIGVDINPKALDAARVNLSGFDRLSLEQADFSSLMKHGPVDLIITNPPYGLRVGTQSLARKQHAKLDALALRVLRPGSTMIVFRPRNFPSPREFQLISRHRVDAGGLDIDILVARKPL